MQIITPGQLGAKIRAARIEKRLTQQELGDMIGVSNVAVSQWERGNGEMPALRTFAKLAHVLDIKDAIDIEEEEANANQN
jgi:transcriptional regulator with XRE-family HTH domain